MHLCKRKSLAMECQAQKNGVESLSMDHLKQKAIEYLAIVDRHSVMFLCIVQLLKVPRSC